jgi:hypothetical protein
MTERPIIVAALPLIPPTQDLFNNILAQEILSPEMIDAALSAAEKYCFSHRTKNAPYADTNNGFLVEAMSMPNDTNPANGLTILSEPTQDGFGARRLYIGANVGGFILLHGRTCCQSLSINATAGFKGTDGQMKIEHRASAEGHQNDHGYQFKGKCLVADSSALAALNHLWMHVRGEKHDCGQHAGYSAQSLNAGPAKPALG